MNANYDDVPTDSANDSVVPSKKTRIKSPSNAQSSSLSANQTKGPIYITVGPQCSGKTTILKSIFGGSFHKNDETSTDNTTMSQAGGIDITIDDQPLVYITVPTGYFLRDGYCNDEFHDVMTKGISLGTEVLGKTVQERINHASNDELKNVIRRLAGQLSEEEFSHRIGEGEVAEDLIAAVEHIMISSNDETCLPDNVDLFIVESIFRPRPLKLMRNITEEKLSHSHSLSALEAALDQLKTHADNDQLHSSTAPMAWGNTNTRPREYTAALEAAKQSGRPVEFIVYGGSEACDMIREHLTRREYRKAHGDAGGEKSSENSSNDEFAVQSQVFSLPKLSRLELFKRNLHRFTKTGRYIPGTAINDAMIRVESLLASAAAEAKKTVDPNTTMTVDDAKFYLDYELAKLADFELNRDRTVQMSTKSIDVDAGRRTNNINGHRGRHGGGRFGRGRSSNGRGRTSRHDFQGKFQSHSRRGRSGYAGRGSKNGRTYSTHAYNPQQGHDHS